MKNTYFDMHFRSRYYIPSQLLSHIYGKNDDK
jgi:hypothetical protein